MMIDNIYRIKHSYIRLFPLQTRDMGFVLYHDLPSAYLLSLLIDSIWFKLDQFKIEYVYPTIKCKNKILENLNNYHEDFFIFSLENYYHSNDYSYWFLLLVLDKLSENKKRPFVIIHSIKTLDNEIKTIMNKYDFVLLFITWDIEDFFYRLFLKGEEIKNIKNIYYREDSWALAINGKENVSSDLNEYILPAYSTWFYTNFLKSKDYIVSILDDDSDVDSNQYYKKSKNEKIDLFRYLPETSVMITTWRWCKYKCSYCYRGVKYSSVRQISLETIKKDLDYLSEMKYEYIYIYDDCFITTNYNRIDEIVELLSDYSFSYWIAARFEVCTPDIIKKISKLKINRIQVWLQSISRDVNLMTKRWFDIDKFEKSILHLKKSWIDVSLDLILWLPLEWLKWFIRTFNYAVSVKPVSIYINTLFLNPWTDLFKNKQKYWIFTDEKDYFWKLFHVPSVLSSNNFSNTDIIIARKYVSYYVKKLKDIEVILR